MRVPLGRATGRQIEVAAIAFHAMNEIRDDRKIEQDDEQLKNVRTMPEVIGFYRNEDAGGRDREPFRPCFSR